MNADGEKILHKLRIVQAERGRRALDADLGHRVLAVKQFQHARFEATYADLLQSPRYGAPARFFLEDLYGPTDFSERDTQFARVVPALVRLFPANIVQTVVELSDLHALSEELDSQMALALDSATLDTGLYRQAWKRVGRIEDRRRQVELMKSIGKSLDQRTRNPLIRTTIHMMRVPARNAGLSKLQAFLEKGLDSFTRMRGADEFLDIIAKRESSFIQTMTD